MLTVERDGVFGSAVPRQSCRTIRFSSPTPRHEGVLSRDLQAGPSSRSDWPRYFGCFQGCSAPILPCHCRIEAQQSRSGLAQPLRLTNALFRRTIELGYKPPQSNRDMVMKYGTTHSVFVAIEVSNLSGWLSASNAERARVGTASC